VCRLFGFRSAVPSRTHRSLVEAENAVATQSKRHQDGWGIGWFVNDDAYLVKSSDAAWACDRFRRVSERLTSHTFIVHVRKATVGRVDPSNAHPFRFGRWLFAHNGTLFSFDDIRDWLVAHTDPELANLTLGDTDSEHLFHYLLTHLAEAGVDRAGHLPSDAALVARVVRTALAALDAEAVRRGHGRPLTNVLLTDGRIFVAHRAGLPLFVSSQKRHCADEKTCSAPEKVCLMPRRPDSGKVNHLLVASEPIGEENRWELIPDGETVALQANFHLEQIPAPPGWTSPPLPPEIAAACALIPEPAP
jgi:predicted glutamine amidotransferase